MTKKFQEVIDEAAKLFKSSDSIAILNCWEQLDILYLERDNVPGEDAATERERIRYAKGNLAERYMHLALLNR